MEFININRRFIVNIPLEEQCYEIIGDLLR